MGEPKNFRTREIFERGREQNKVEKKRREGGTGNQNEKE